MDLKQLLNQALSSDIVKQGSQKISQTTQGIDKSQLATLGTGAAAGGILGLLMGSKKARKMGKKVGKAALGVGGAAALGALAYKVYNDWQGGNGGPSEPQPENPPQALNDNQHSMIILTAMIAAAKADGHIDPDEQARIEQAVAQLGAGDEVNQFVSSELQKPLDPAEIARQAASPQQASEIYLASLLVADEQNFMEKAYLKELASQLGLQPDLVAQLEAQVAG